MGRPGCGWGDLAPNSAGVEWLEFHPWDFMPNPTWGQNNPPLLVPYPQSNGWFSNAIEFVQSDDGGSWVQCSLLVPPDVDATIDPEFTVHWCTDVVGGGNVRFDLHYTANADGTVIAGGGPGTAINDTTAAANTLQITTPAQIAATGGGTWGPSQIININLYRGVAASSDIGGSVFVFGLIMKFQRT